MRHGLQVEAATSREEEVSGKGHGKMKGKTSVEDAEEPEAAEAAATEVCLTELF